MGAIFMPSLCAPWACEWNAYGARRRSEAETRARSLPVLDVIYLGVGLAVLALMTLYAYACDHL